MTLDEFCEKFGYNKSTVQNNFKRTVENMLKKGLLLTREGRGSQADYKVTIKED